MGLFDQIKDAIAPKAENLANALNLDDGIIKLFDEIVDKLKGLNADGKLDKLATKALEKFEPVLAQFKLNGEAGKDAISGLLEKGKTFLNGLSEANLPDELKGLLEKLKGLIK